MSDHLRAVPDEPAGPLPFETANAEFQTHWAAARTAHGAVIMAAGALAHPLFVQRGNITRTRIDAAVFDAERIALHARELATELVACRELWDRAQAGADKS